MIEERAMRTPPGQRDQDAGERESLSDLDADVEADDVGDEAVGRQFELLKLRGQTETVKQAEDEHRDARVRLKAKEALEAIHVLERLVDDGEADDGVDEKRIGANAAEHSGEQRHAMADGEQTDVEEDVLESVEKEDDADEEEQMVVARHHVLRAEIHQRSDRRPVETLQVDRVLARHAMRVQRG